jgi:uncharacterized C2H2 Zn-finger protein
MIDIQITYFRTVTVLEIDGVRLGVFPRGTDAVRKYLSYFEHVEEAALILKTLEMPNGKEQVKHADRLLEALNDEDRFYTVFQERKGTLNKQR